jgi:hypothetical protein
MDDMIHMTNSKNCSIDECGKSADQPNFPMARQSRAWRKTAILLRCAMRANRRVAPVL